MREINRRTAHQDRQAYRCFLAASLFCASLAVMAGTATAVDPLQDFPALSGLRSQHAAQSPGTSPEAATKQDIVRPAPSISGRLQLRDQTLLPFVGAGFGAGYASDRDRALGSDLSSPSSGLFGNGLTKGLMPNEFQMGVRIPF
jgi:hypothetical protein